MFHQFFQSIQNSIQTNFLPKQPKISAPDRIGSTAVRVSALTVKNGDVRPRVRFPLGAEQVIDLVLADRTANTKAVETSSFTNFLKQIRNSIQFKQDNFCA